MSVNLKKISYPHDPRVVYVVRRGSTMLGMIEKVKRPVGSNEAPWEAFRGVGQARVKIGDFVSGNVVGPDGLVISGMDQATDAVLYGRTDRIPDVV